jgi:hypothetical protein
VAQAVINFCLREQRSGGNSRDPTFASTSSNPHVQAVATSSPERFQWSDDSAISSDLFSARQGKEKKPLSSSLLSSYVNVFPTRYGRRRKPTPSSDLARYGEKRITKPRAEPCAEHVKKKKRASDISSVLMGELC